MRRQYNGKEITSYFQPKKKQTTTCEDEEPSAASIEVTGDGVEPLIFGGINRNSEQNPQNPEIVNEGIDSENTDEIIDFNSLIRDPGRCGSNTFTVKGLNRWRKVNNGKDCAFRCHVGKGDGSNSAHNFAAKCYYNLKNQPCHLEKIVEKQSAEEIKQNRMRLKTSIDAIKWLTFQVCAFRGHDESCNSKNQGNPRDGYRSFNIENICKLAEKFYPEDFLGDEKIHLQCELQHYGLDVPVHPDLKNLSTLGDLCHRLVTTGKADMYPLVDRLLRLVLTLPASTATSERAFSAMKIVKTSLRNRMEDEFLRDYLIVYIEKEIAETISAEEIIDSFYLIKEKRTHLK
ncbi:hypothetical protein AgCh_000894 [Apium graveolens]